jgi:hypothetical protein
VLSSIELKLKLKLMLKSKIIYDRQSVGLCLGVGIPFEVLDEIFVF